MDSECYLENKNKKVRFFSYILKPKCAVLQITLRIRYLDFRTPVLVIP